MKNLDTIKEGGKKKCLCCNCTQKIWNYYHGFVLFIVDPVGILLIASAYIFIGHSSDLSVFNKFFNPDYVPLDNEEIVKLLLINFKRITLPLLILWIFKFIAGCFWLKAIWTVEGRRKEDNAFMAYFLVSFAFYLTTSVQVFFIITLSI